MGRWTGRCRAAAPHEVMKTKVKNRKLNCLVDQRNKSLILLIIGGILYTVCGEGVTLLRYSK